MRIEKWRSPPPAIFLPHVVLVVVLQIPVVLTSGRHAALITVLSTLAALRTLTFGQKYFICWPIRQSAHAIWSSILLALWNATLQSCWRRRYSAESWCASTFTKRWLIDTLHRCRWCFPTCDARPGDHGLLSGAAGQRWQRDLDHADRLCDALHAPAACAVTAALPGCARSSRNRPPWAARQWAPRFGLTRCCRSPGRG